MLGFLRNFLKSRIGVGIALAFFGIIALGFALGSVASSGGLSGFASADTAATVGHDTLATAAVARGVNQMFDSAHNQDRQLTMRSFVAEGGFDQAVSQAIDRTAILAFGAASGITAGKPLIDSELRKIPALQGPDGHFSNSLYRQLLVEKQLSDSDVRNDIASSLVARQALLPAGYGAAVPLEAARRYAALAKERRVGALAAFPAAVFAPKTPPSAAQVAAFYASHRAVFTLPERRTIRFAIFDASAAKAAAPSDAEIAAYYAANASHYAASDTRKVTLLVLPDEASAIAAKASGSLSAAAQAKGLATNTLGPLDRAALALQSSPEVAAAAFAAHSGAMLGPIKTALGLTVAHVDAADSKPARSLAAAHGEIAAALAVQKQQAAFGDLTARLDDQFSHGGALSDAAKAIGATLNETPPLTANGQVFGRPGVSPPKALGKLIATAFAMEREHAPQVADMGDGKHFAIFDVSQITAAAPAPLAAIQPQVAGLWALDKGNVGAHAAALKVLAAVRKGASLAKAVSAVGVALPPIQPLTMGREELGKFKGQVPPAIQLFFAMAAGTAKPIPADGGRGWAVIAVSQVIPGIVTPSDPLLGEASKALSSMLGDEYATELQAAVRNTVGVKRNEAAIAKLKSQLGGG